MSEGLPTSLKKFLKKLFFSFYNSGRLHLISFRLNQIDKSRGNSEESVAAFDNLGGERGEMRMTFAHSSINCIAS